MPATKDLGRVFAHSIYLTKDAPLVHRAPTQELDEPFRISNSFVARLWPSRYGVVVGWWKDSGFDEDEAFYAAVGWDTDLDVLDDTGHIVDQYELREF